VFIYECTLITEVGNMSHFRDPVGLDRVTIAIGSTDPFSLELEKKMMIER
jgi:hypothetical protein